MSIDSITFIFDIKYYFCSKQKGEIKQEICDGKKYMKEADDCVEIGIVGRINLILMLERYRVSQKLYRQ